MKLSTKGRYAVTAMLELAINGDREPVTLAGISVEQGISLSYLEQLFGCLRRQRLVKGVRGPGGGYYLGRPVSEISIADIICAVDEWGEFNHSKTEPEGSSRLTHALWNELSNDVFDFLKQITLGDLLARGAVGQGFQTESHEMADKTAGSI
jgi:Rrf2 family iron-sulfur cluster assembly transcriptional regulator